MANVFIVDINVDEAAQCVLIRIQMIPQFSVSRGQRVECFTGSRCFNDDTRLAVRELTERCRDCDCDWHGYFPFQQIDLELPFRQKRGTTFGYSPGLLAITLAAVTKNRNDYRVREQRVC